MKRENSILKVLAWFDLFNYPLTAAEILFFLDRKTTEEELKTGLQQLVEEGMLFRLGGFYSLQNDELLVIRRTRGNNRAKQLLTTAHRVSKLLYHFPFVRGIGISGSLSKNFADEKADIDLFVITRSNRLWIARSTMHLLKKMSYLVGRQHWFCLNYFIDEEALLIGEKNFFTATELITLMPVCGNGAIDHFFHANTWAKTFYPNYDNKMPVFKDNGKGHWLKKGIEWLLNNRLGNRLDDYLMRITTRNWKQKYEQGRFLNMRGEQFGVDVNKHFCKPNPSFFQKRILDKYQQRLDALQEATRFRKQGTN